MGSLAVTARHHADEIRRYFNHAGIAGYSQALHHYAELSELVQRANGSKRGRSELPEIVVLLQSAGPLMDE